MAFTFVTRTDCPHAQHALQLMARFGVSTRTFSGEALPEDLANTPDQVVACFDSDGKYPGNNLRVLQKSDVAPGNKCQFVVPAWTTPIKLGRRVAVRPIPARSRNDERLEQALREMHHQVTGVRMPVRPLARAPQAVGGGYHLPRDTWRGDDQSVGL